MEWMLFQVFAGNTDRNTVITHSLRPHIDARFIRFHPKTHNHNIPCLRVELHGCRKGKFSADKDFMSSKPLIKSQFTLAQIFLFLFEIDFFWFLLPPVKNCLMPVGVEDGRIPDEAFTASSSVRSSYLPNRGRLNLLPSGGKYCWAAGQNNANQWLRVWYRTVQLTSVNYF